MKCADDLVLLATEEKVLWGMIRGLTETGRGYEVEMNVYETKVMRISTKPSPLQITTKKKKNWRMWNI